MGNESSERIQTSILNKMEKKLLIWLAQRQPAWITSDFLTFIGVIGAVLFAIGGILAHIDTKFLWLASLGLVINWYGDSLDGTLARVRRTQKARIRLFHRPHFRRLDHMSYLFGTGTVSHDENGRGISDSGRIFVLVHLYLRLHYHYQRIPADIRQTGADGGTIAAHCCQHLIYIHSVVDHTL